MVAAKLFDPAAGRQRVDRYELIGEVASGGMATVYLARLTGVGGFQRFVAMKRLHPHLATEREFVEMFLDEARLAAGIHHPNVVPILEVGASAVGYYLVMEYIEGDTLARLLARASSRGKRIPQPIALRIALDMLAGLQAAHELRDDRGQVVQLVHRDVSPQNVLVGSDGITRITDFGVARAASRLSATRAGQLKGKIAYMAPEQAKGDEGLDRRADVFSAGVVLWEALSAKRLFKSDNEAATLSRILTESAPSLAEVAPEIAPELSAVVMRALSRDRDARFGSAAQFADALEASVQGEGRPATTRELAAYVEEVMGDEIARQREAVRQWLTHTESLGSNPAVLGSGISPSSSVSAATMSVPRESARSSDTTLAEGPQRSRSPMLTLFTVLLLSGGVGGYYGVRMLRGTGQSSHAVAPAAPPPAHVSVVPEASSSLRSLARAEAEPSALAGEEQHGQVLSAAVSASSAPRASVRSSAAKRKRKVEDVIPPNPYR